MINKKNPIYVCHMCRSLLLIVLPLSFNFIHTRFSHTYFITLCTLHWSCDYMLFGVYFIVAWSTICPLDRISSDTCVGIIQVQCGCHGKFNKNSNTRNLLEELRENFLLYMRRWEPLSSMLDLKYMIHRNVGVNVQIHGLWSRIY